MLNATEIVLDFTRALDRLGIAYMLVGSFSSSFYGRPRLTMDADFVIDVADLSFVTLQEALGGQYRIDPQMSFEGVTGTTRRVVTHPATAFTVELFQLSRDSRDQVWFQRRRRERIEGHVVTLPTAEDVVITKLRWAKGGV